MCPRKMEQMDEVPRPRRHGGMFGYMVTGLAFGAALSFFFAPKSGVETRKWMAEKFLNAVDKANEKVRTSRAQVHEFVDRGQEQLTRAVATQREAMGIPKQPAVRATVT